MHPRYRANYRVLQSIRAGRLRRGYAVARVAAKRAIVRRAFTGGAIAAGAVAGYGMYRGVKRFKRARSRARMRKKRKIGVSPYRKIPVKAEELDLTSRTAKFERTMHVFELTALTRDAANHAHDRRHTHLVNWRGWRIQKLFENTRTDPVKIHIAIVTTKTSNLSPISSGVSVDDFFRECSDDRSKSFNGTAGTGQQNEELHWLKINPDRYETLYRWSKTLPGVTGISDSRKLFWSFNKYIPFKRRLHYDDSTGFASSGRTYLVFWYAGLNGRPSTNTSSVFQSQHICGFYNDAIDDH